MAFTRLFAKNKQLKPSMNKISTLLNDISNHIQCRRYARQELKALQLCTDYLREADINKKTRLKNDLSNYITNLNKYANAFETIQLIYKTLQALSVTLPPNMEFTPEGYLDFRRK